MSSIPLHHYPRHIGDYQKKTKGFSLAEHGAYSQLMDEYYTTETPLPLDKDRLYRICGAVTKPEKAAVDSVLASHFAATDDGYRNSRCDEEIEKYRTRAYASRENGRRGGRPSKIENPAGNPENNLAGNLERTRGDPTSKGNPGTQKPEPRNQSGPVRSGPGFDWRKLPDEECLASTATVMDWFSQESAKAGIAEDSDENRVWVLAAAERALREKNIENRPNLFVVLITEFVEGGCKANWKLKNYRAKAEVRFKKWKAAP